MAKKKTSTDVLPGIDVPGYDKDVTAAGLEVVSAKEEVAKAKAEEKRATEELLETMREKKLSRYHDADAKIRVEVSRSKETVKVLKDKPPSKEKKGMVSRGGRL